MRNPGYDCRGKQQIKLPQLRQYTTFRRLASRTLRSGSTNFNKLASMRIERNLVSAAWSAPIPKRVFQEKPNGEVSGLTTTHPSTPGWLVLALVTSKTDVSHLGSSPWTQRRGRRRSRGGG